MPTHLSTDDCFRILELQSDASEDEIRSSFRRLMKVWHPDRFQHDPELRTFAEERCKNINLAYEGLSNPRTETPSPENARPKAEEFFIGDMKYSGHSVMQFGHGEPERTADQWRFEDDGRTFYDDAVRIGRKWKINFTVGLQEPPGSDVRVEMLFD